MAKNNFTLAPWQKMFYNANGYLVIDDVFSKEECEQAVATFEKYVLSDYRGIMNMERGAVEYREYAKTQGGVDGTLRIDVEDKDAEFVWEKLLRHQKIVTTLDTLQGAEAVQLQSMFLFKRAGTRYANQAWWPHQDAAYPMADYGMYITGNICFTAQDPSNGGMYIYPGSHREPILPYESMKSFHEKEGENPGHRVRVPEKYAKIDLCFNQGCVLFLHGNVIHGSYANDSPDRSREMLLIPYGTKEISHGKNFKIGRTGQRYEHSLRRPWREVFGTTEHLYSIMKG